MHPLVEKAIETAEGEVGVHETGPANWGPRVREYLEAVEIRFPAPWCAAYVRWCLREAARRTGVPERDVPILAELRPREFAYCPFLASYAGRDGILARTPRRGDLFLLHNGERFCHTGIVTDTAPGGYHTLEGNTSVDGSREGTGVFARFRPHQRSTRFARWGDELPGAALPKAVGKGYSLYLGRKCLGRMPLVAGRSLVPVRTWGEALGFTVTWDADRQQVRFDGRPLEAEVTVLGAAAYAPLRSLVAAAGLKLTVEDAARRAVAHR